MVSSVQDNQNSVSYVRVSSGQRCNLATVFNKHIYDKQKYSDASLFCITIYTGWRWVNQITIVKLFLWLSGQSSLSRRSSYYNLINPVVRKITLLIIFGFIPEMRSLKKWVVAAANWIARARATDFRVSDEDKNGVQ